MRHAKSSWKEPLGSDHARPLKGRGRREALRAAQELAALGWTPEQVLSSDSARTQETWANMTAGLHESIPSVVFSRALYHGGLESLRGELSSVDEQTHTLLVLGHNPGWEMMVDRLAGLSGVVLKTAHAALMSVTAESWAVALDLEGAWQLEQIVDPRRLLEQEAS